MTLSKLKISARCDSLRYYYVRNVSDIGTLDDDDDDDDVDGDIFC